MFVARGRVLSYNTRAKERGSLPVFPARYRVQPKGRELPSKQASTQPRNGPAGAEGPRVGGSPFQVGERHFRRRLIMRARRSESFSKVALISLLFAGLAAAPGASAQPAPQQPEQAKAAQKTGPAAP